MSEDLYFYKGGAGMKYIRTKDDIEIVVREFEKELVVRSKDEKYYPNHKINKKFVLNQADTIEELCDFCEIDYTDNIYEIYDLTREEYPKGFIENHIDDGLIVSVFVGLKTNKGLIYVAKMKGVLPNGEMDWELL